MGSWQGQGNHTIGVVSESGRFRIHWYARHTGTTADGTFRLTVHSAVSGRPLQVVADQRGEGSGTVDFADDPRSYNFMVESAGLDWWFSVDELVAGYGDGLAPRPADRQPARPRQ